MVETQPIQQNSTFTEIQFVTKDGEKCTATKNNGIVTVKGDKNGVRQLPYDQFMKELIGTLPKNVNLERIPNKDSVQFSGNEEPAKTESAATAEDSIDETNKKLNKKYLGIAATALAVVGTGIYLLGRGKWWSKAAKEVEKKGKDMVDDATDAIRDGIKGGDKSGDTTGKSVDEVIKQSEELIGTSGKTTPKTTQKNLFIAESPIPKEQILEIPKDLELSVEKVVQQGREVGRGFDTAGKGVDTVTYTIPTQYGYRAYRVTETKGKPIEIKDVLDYGSDSRPFRTFEFQNGQVRSITDNTTKNINKRFFKVWKKAPAEELKLPKSPIPENELLEIPKDLETDFINVVRNGSRQNIDGRVYLLKSSDGLTKRVYYLDSDILHIEKVLEFSNGGIKPFRKIYFTDGQVSKIEDLTSATPRIKEFHVKSKETKLTKNKPADTPKEHVQQTMPEQPTQKTDTYDELLKQQEAERLRRQEQEAINNENDIINAAIIADMASGAGKKGTQKVAGKTGNTLTDVTKIEIPNSQSVIEDGKRVADDLLGHNPKSAATQINPPETAADNIFNPNNTDNIIPQSSTFEDPLATNFSDINRISEIEPPEMPGIIHDEPFGTDFGGTFDGFDSMIG